MKKNKPSLTKTAKEVAQPDPPKASIAAESASSRKAFKRKTKAAISAVSPVQVVDESSAAPRPGCSPPPFEAI